MPYKMKEEKGWVVGKVNKFESRWIFVNSVSWDKYVKEKAKVETEKEMEIVGSKMEKPFSYDTKEVCSSPVKQLFVSAQGGVCYWKEMHIFKIQFLMQLYTLLQDVQKHIFKS